MLVVVVDVAQAGAGKPRRRSAIPGTPARWNGSTSREENWGVRSIPHIDKPLSALGAEEPRPTRSMPGAGTSPTPREGRRETLVTSVLDAEPIQVLRVAGPTYRHRSIAAVVTRRASSSR